MDLDKIHNLDILEGLKLLPDNSIDLVVTSPPYNVGIDYDTWDDKLAQYDYFNWVAAWMEGLWRVLKPDGRIAINIPYEVNFKGRGGRVFILADYYRIASDIGFNFGGVVDLKEIQPHRVKLTAWGSWLSPSAPYIYNPKECVMILYKTYWKKDVKGTSYFDGSPESKEEFKEYVFGEWSYRAETSGKTKANFSMDIPEKAIKILSYKENIILDPFMGSGTTAMASKKLGRNYIGFEISPTYCDVAKERLNSV